MIDASLIKYEYFDEIISTNIDDVLEGALDQTEMRQGRDYEVMRIDPNTSRFEKNHPCRIIKPFGDLVSRYYAVKGRASRLENENSRTFLQSLLAKNLLIVGIDPTWDRDILRIIPVEASGTIWLVSEQEDIIDNSPDLATLLYKRSSACTLGHEGSYGSFILKIHNYLHESNFSNYQHLVAKRVDFQPRMEEKLADLRTKLQILQEQIIHITSVLDESRSFQKDTSEILREFQKIQKSIEDIEKQ